MQCLYHWCQNWSLQMRLPVLKMMDKGESVNDTICYRKYMTSGVSSHCLMIVHILIYRNTWLYYVCVKLRGQCSSISMAENLNFRLDLCTRLKLKVCIYWFVGACCRYIHRLAFCFIFNLHHSKDKQLYHCLKKLFLFTLTKKIILETVLYDIFCFAF